MKSAKFAIVALMMIASNTAFAGALDDQQPVDLDFAVALESAKSEVMAARQDMSENYAQAEISRSPASERTVIIIGDEI